MKKVGYIDARRQIIGGVPGWSQVPALLIPGQLKAYGIMEDFLGYVLADAAEPSIPNWLCANTSTVLSIADIVGGCVLLQTGAGNEDTGQMQLGDGVGGAFWPAAGKDIWFEARVKQTITGTNTLNLAFGLQDPCGATEILADAGAGPAAQNHLMFLTLDTGAGVNAWSFRGGKVAAATTNALAKNLESLVFHTYGFHVRGVTQVDVYYDRALIAAAKILTANIPVTGLMPFVCIKTGTTEIEAVYVDYIMCVQLR